MIIYGSRTREVAVGGGGFFCPRCNSNQPYTLMEAKRYFTLYFIPLFPMYSQGRHVECRSCGGTWATSVLSLADHAPSAVGPAPTGAPSADNVRHLLTLVCAKAGRTGSDSVEKMKQLLQHSGLTIPADHQILQEVQMAQSAPVSVRDFAAQQFAGSPADFKQQLLQSSQWLFQDGRAPTPIDRQVIQDLAAGLGLQSPM